MTSTFKIICIGASTNGLNRFRGDIVDVGDVAPMASEDMLTFAEAYDIDGVEVDGRDGNFFVSRRNRAGE